MMDRLLPHVNTSPRKPCSMPVRSSSIKPGLATPPIVSRNRRISPSVTSKGSPRPMARPSSPSKAIVTITKGSRIPRKSGVPPSLSNGTRAASGAGSPHPALPEPHFVAKVKGASPLGQPPASPSSLTINLDKELPSPPIIQVVNPFSPVKAKRTLVDATVATPTEQKWPIIRPENVETSKNDAVTSETDQDRLVDSPRTDSSRSSVSTEKTKSVEILGNSGSSSDIGCAISTSDNKALDSPLARKTSIRLSTTISPTAVPPRDSSMHGQRSSPPLPNKSQSSSGNDVSSPRPSPMKPGSTTWPLLDTSPTYASLLLASGHHHGSRETDTMTQLDDEEESAEVTKFFETYHTALSQQIPTDSSSTSIVCGGVIENNEEPGLGPILTIANDADAILLGNSSPILEAPPIMDNVSVKSQEKSLGTLAGRISRQTMSKISLAKSRSTTPHSSEIETNGGTPIRITPIRSMQPPRRGSAESGNSFSSHARFEHSNIKLESAKRSSQPPVVPPKASQILGIRSKSLTKSIRTPTQLSEDIPPLGLSRVRNTTVDRSNTSPALIPSASRYHRTSPYGTTSAISTSGFTPRPAQLNVEACGSGPSKRKPTVSAELYRAPSAQQDRRSPNVLKERELQQLKPGSTPSAQIGKNGKSSSEGAATVKSKRSFRNLFHKRDLKETSKVPQETSSGRLSITTTGRTIAKRFRNSANFSKTTLHKEEFQYKPEDEPEHMHNAPASVPQTLADRCAQLPKIATPISPGVEAPSAINLEFSHIIGNIIDRVRALPQGSPDRLRGLEIAEVMLNAIETVKEAGIAAEKAKKYARNCELYVHTTNLQVNRLIKLVESDFEGDGEIVQGIRELMKVLGLVSDEAAPAS